MSLPVVTAENYYSPEMNMAYMGSTQFKAFEKCEAAALAELYHQDLDQVEYAAEVAMEHHLGLTCDPICGLVQIPCIERNAMGAIKAYNAAVITSGTDPYSQRVSLDAAIAAMAETGREMSCKFKETSLGGLAVSMVAC